MRKENNNKKSAPKIALTVLGVIAIVLIAGVCAYMIWERAPEIEPEAPAAQTGAPAGAQPLSEAEEPGSAQAMDSDRAGEVYTILLVGNDDGRGNTDTIIVGRIDTGAHKMDFVSIPRDTLVNINWNIRKINAVYAGTANSGGVAIDGLKQQIRNLTGFTVDCYAVIDLDVFIEAVDLIGGVDFDVPQAMHYEDPNQDLYIHLDPGYQHLNGVQAMGVVRYRAGYANGDLGRVEMQQQFLKACVSQFISLGSMPHFSELVSLLAENMDTDLSAANLAFFARQALLCKSEDVNFHTMPNTPATVHELSYTFVNLEPWLEMINECLNPYEDPVTAANVDIVYLANGGIQTTSGNLRGAWYFTETSETTPPSTEPVDDTELTVIGEDEAAPSPTDTAILPVETPAPEEQEPEPEEEIVVIGD